MNILSLSGTYELSGAGRTCTAVIPGDFHSALISAGILPDPYYAKNEADVQWVGETDWTIKRLFQYTVRKSCHAFLVMTGADTFFSVYVNGKKAGTGCNMFRLWRFDITDLLADGSNSIEIRFDSPVKKAQQEAEELPYPVPSSTYPVSAPHCNLIRKPQCHGGWDWGPCLMVSGIYDTIQIETVQDGYADSPTVRYRQNGQIWTADISVPYTALCKTEKKFLFSISDGHAVISEKAVSFSLVPGTTVLSASLDVTDPELWLTSEQLSEAGKKTNMLYTLSVASADGDTSCTKKIAFRTLTVDTKGGALCFCINGQKIFAKGANWIPADALPSRQTDGKIRWLLESAVQAHMNIIRVWGGGQFERDSFYEMCDELGLLIWHDCMFACAAYPASEQFLSNVAEELAYQIPRLQTHPSIALWCGNNENIGALTWFPETKANRDRYIVDYDRLYHGVVEKAVRTYDPDRTWWPSSPSSGSDKDLFNDNWHCDDAGDMHFWSVWHQKKSFSEYLTIQPRFVSEFGYEAFPSIAELKTYTPEDQMNLTSPVMEYHQRSAGGNSIILENFSRYFRFPEGFENMVYLSQVQQALAIKTAVSYWRSLRPRCSGAIFWQLNDVWPDASWSSIEYSGKWKLLHYAMKDAFLPVCTVLYKKDGEYRAYILNDTSAVIKAELTIRMIDFSGNPAGQAETIQAEAGSGTAVCAWKLAEKDLICAPDSCFIYAELKAADGKGKTYAADDTLFPSLYKNCTLQKADVSVKADDAENGTCTLYIESDKPAFFAALDAENIQGTFSRNMMTLLPGKTVTVTFTPRSGTVTAAELMRHLSVTTLRDTYR